MAHILPFSIPMWWKYPETYLAHPGPASLGRPRSERPQALRPHQVHPDLPKPSVVNPAQLGSPNTSQKISNQTIFDDIEWTRKQMKSNETKDSHMKPNETNNKEIWARCSRRRSWVSKAILKVPNHWGTGEVTPWLFPYIKYPPRA